MQLEIRKMKPYEWDEMIELVWKTFLVFEAPLFDEEGVKSFLDFISDERLKKLYEIGEFVVFTGYLEGKMVGTISLRNDCHVSLLFVSKTYHKIGIGRELLFHAEEYVKNNTNKNCLTVNAAPYAVEFYHRLGFVDVEGEKHQDGIIFTPMKKLFA